MTQNKFLPVLLGLVVLISGMLWYTGSYKTLFSSNISNQVGNSLALDLETLQITIRTVSSPLIEELQFVEAIDTLNAKESIKDLRNPFTKVYVAPPPEEKPKEKPKAKPKKKTTKKPKKRKKRIVRPKISMTGIIWDRSNPYAILNGDIYGQGDLIQGYTVQTIQDTIIFLANNDDIFSIVIEE
ncbi:MAG: hypothetical protein U9Q77_08075 [Candidatus Marinimicrobia bacterium]|nr:hypothetical protein [Candidatus Neomarinimicrobiota bacterium]